MLYFMDHAFMVQHNFSEYKESDIFVLFCNKIFQGVFQNETLTSILYGNTKFLHLSPERGAANPQRLSGFRQVAICSLRGGDDRRFFCFH